MLAQTIGYPHAVESAHLRLSAAAVTFLCKIIRKRANREAHAVQPAETLDTQSSAAHVVIYKRGARFGPTRFMFALRPVGHVDH